MPEHTAEKDAPHVHDSRGQLDRSICGVCGEPWWECSVCGVYFCDCTRVTPPGEGRA